MRQIAGPRHTQPGSRRLRLTLITPSDITLGVRRRSGTLRNLHESPGTVIAPFEISRFASVVSRCRCGESHPIVAALCLPDGIILEQ